MTLRWTRVAPFALCAAFAALGVWSLATGDYTTGALQLEFSAFWLLMAIWDRWPAILGERRDAFKTDTGWQGSAPGPSATAIPRWMRIAYIVVGLTFVVIGISELVKGNGNSASGGIQVAIGVGLLLLAAFKRKSPSLPKSERDAADHPTDTS